MNDKHESIIHSNILAANFQFTWFLIEIPWVSKKLNISNLKNSDKKKTLNMFMYGIWYGHWIDFAKLLFTVVFMLIIRKLSASFSLTS